MRGKKLDLMLTDCAYIGGRGQGLQYPEWSSREPWDRPQFPSQQARIYMRHYTGSRGAGGSGPDFPASVPLHESVSPVAAVANRGAITKKRIKVSVLPLFLQGAAGAPRSVVAVEEWPMIEAKQMQYLTLPISAYFPVGSVFPWDSPYYTEDIATFERNRAHLFYISMGSGTGTRLRTPGFGSAAGAQVREIDLDSLVNREAVVLKIAKDRGEV